MARPSRGRLKVAEPSEDRVGEKLLQEPRIGERSSGVRLPIYGVSSCNGDRSSPALPGEEIARTGCEPLPEDFRARITPAAGSPGPGRAGLHPSIQFYHVSVLSPSPERMPGGGTSKLLGGRPAAFAFASARGTFIFTRSEPAHRATRAARNCSPDVSGFRGCF